jgi:hypothetical protein
MRATKAVVNDKGNIGAVITLFFLIFKRTYVESIDRVTKFRPQSIVLKM